MDGKRAEFGNKSDQGANRMRLGMGPSSNAKEERQVSPSKRHSRVIMVSSEYGRKGKWRAWEPEPKKPYGRPNMVA